MAYVYEHWRSDTGQPFWVGKGSKDRARLLNRRNKYHSAIVEKLASVGGCVQIKIVADGLTDEEAFALEIERIAFWKAAGIKLANCSTGGRGGLSGCKRSLASRLKQIETATGRKLSPDHLQKLINRVRSPEGKRRNSLLHFGRKRLPETGHRISEAKKRHWADPEIRNRHIDGQKRTKKPVSEETRAKMRAAKTPEVRERLRQAAERQWKNAAFRKLVSDTMKRTNEKRRQSPQCE